MTWAIRTSPELGKVVIGVAKAFGIFILLLDKTSIVPPVDRIQQGAQNRDSVYSPRLSIEPGELVRITRLQRQQLEREDRVIVR